MLILSLSLKHNLTAYFLKKKTITKKRTMLFWSVSDFLGVDS